MATIMCLTRWSVALVLVSEYEVFETTSNEAMAHFICIHHVPLRHIPLTYLYQNWAM